MGGGEVIKRGWLVKSPPLEGGGMKAWRRRYFMLRSSKVLEYYKSSDGEVLKGVINLEDCKTVHSDLSHKKYKHVFDVETKDRTYYLVAHTQEEMKEWVEVLCRVCGLIVQDVPEFLSSTEPPLQPASSATAGPTITPPIYATPPVRGGGGAYGPNHGTYGTLTAVRTEGAYGSHAAPRMEGAYGSHAAPRVEGAYGTHPVPRTGGGQATPPVSRVDNGGATGGGISFNERFAPSGQGTAVESLYSLAQADAEVQRQLSGEQEIPSGIPLSEALASKGIGGSHRSSSLSLPSVAEPAANFTRDSPSVFSPPPQEPARDGQNLYTPGPRKPVTADTGGGGGGGVARPVPKPRSATLRPTVPSTAEQLGSPALQQLTSSLVLSDSTTQGPHPTQLMAEYTADGYLNPQPSSQPKKASNYDRLPPGPPRPAVRVSGEVSPRQHRSALLNPTLLAPDNPPSSKAPNYINVQPEEAPPMVDRRNKPAMPSPPRVDRNLKPRTSGGGSEDVLPAVAISRSSSSSSGESPPMFPTRTTSLQQPAANTQQVKQEESPPEFPVRTTSLEVSASAASSVRDEEESLDIPKPSTRTMQYTQIAFSPTTGNPVMGETPEGATIEKRMPVPAPRRRVNYSDVDIAASNKLSEETAAGAADSIRNGLKEVKVSLQEAEMQALKDKPYVNVNRKGKVDEETDPGYYTHMRNLTYQEALEIYNMPIDSIDNEEDEEEEEFGS